MRLGTGEWRRSLAELDFDGARWRLSLAEAEQPICPDIPPLYLLFDVARAEWSVQQLGLFVTPPAA